MRCPKCNYDITEEMLVCPNCKKVLKLVCPKCKNINKTNTCKKCGFVIISKCHNCGKINQTINNVCSKCGFSTYTSVAINSSNIDEFACLTIEFPNLNDVKSHFGSKELANKFIERLDNLIFNYVHSIGMNREIINNIYIVRFNKDNSLKSSAINSMKAAIEIQNLITELNFRLKKINDNTLKCNIAVLKRDIYSSPEQYSSGFNISLIYPHQKNYDLLNNLQIITDSYIYEQVSDQFDLSELTAKFIKNEMIMFFELNLTKYIKMPQPNEEAEKDLDLGKLNIFDEITNDEDEKDDIYDIDAIHFDELKCTFKKVKSVNLVSDVVNRILKNPKGIISIKSKKELFPQTDTMLASIESCNIYKNIFRVTCYDEMKYKPYGFFYELLSVVYNCHQSPKLFADHKINIAKIDPSNFVKDLINLTERKFPHPEDVRYALFDIFFEIFKSMSNSLIYIENFEKIDDTSYDFLKIFFERFKELNIGCLIIADEDFSLHKASHYLLADPNYIEITVKRSTFKDMIEKHLQQYDAILDSYYMQKIAQYTKGSVLYFNNIIEYLLDKKLLSFHNKTFSVVKFENILIPTNLNELITKKLQNLYGDDDKYKLFAMLLLIGPRIDVATLNLLNPNGLDIVKDLAGKHYVYTHKNIVYIQNYNLYKENFLASVNEKQKQDIANELLEKAFFEKIKHPVEANLYQILVKAKQEFIVWESLLRLNASVGDFSAYFNCSTQVLKLLDEHINESSQQAIDEYKMDIYENISNLLYKYTPNKIHNIAQIILTNLEKTTNDKKIVNLCNKMLQGCLISGNYSYALELVRKILSKFPNASINVNDKNFNITFFLVSLVKIEILFSMGNLNDCIDSGEELLNVINAGNIILLKPKNLSQKYFEESIYDALAFTALAKIILLKDNLEEFIEKIEKHLKKLPKVFELFLVLEKVIRGIKIKLPDNFPLDNDKFSESIFNIIIAFNDYKDNYEKFADKIYQAKISSKAHHLTQIELFCDLMIGYSYYRLNKFNKASSIYYNVLETSTKNGLKMITLLDWYLISMLKLEDTEVAFGIANNAIIQQEQDPNSSDFLLFLLKILLAEILKAKNYGESAELCLENAKFIREKYGLSFSLGEV